MGKSLKKSKVTAKKLKQEKIFENDAKDNQYDIIIINKREFINKKITESNDESNNLYKLEIKGLFLKHKNKFYNSIEFSFTLENLNFDIVLNKKEIFPFLNDSELDHKDNSKFVAVKRKRQNSKSFCEKKNFYREKLENKYLEQLSQSDTIRSNMDKNSLRNGLTNNFKGNHSDTAIAEANTREIIINKSKLFGNHISNINHSNENKKDKINSTNIFNEYNTIIIDVKKYNLINPLRGDKSDHKYNRISPLTNFSNKYSLNSQSYYPLQSNYLNSNKSLNNSQMNNFLNKNIKKIKQMNVDVVNNINDLSESFHDFCDLNSSSFKLNNTTSQIIPIKQGEPINLLEDDSVFLKKEDRLHLSGLNANSIPSFPNDKDEEFVVKYNYISMKGNETSILLYENDFHKLNPKVYLNDNIILFYLKFIENEFITNDLIGKFIIFDTFFYNKLEKEEDGSFETGLRNYNSVKNWTKKLKVFQADFLIIPINENNEHWSLIIILYPGKIANIFGVNKIESNEQFPTVIYLDSFYDNNIRCINILKKYLFYEYAVKIENSNLDVTLIDYMCMNHNKIKTYVPNVPKQNNTYDCGIYLLAYAELFLYEPEYILQRIKDGCDNLSDWFLSSFVKSKREDIQNLLLQLFNLQKNKTVKADIVNQFKQNRQELLMISYRQRKLKEIESHSSNLMDCDLSELSISKFNGDYQN